MKRLSSALCASVLSLSVGIGGAMPAFSAPVGFHEVDSGSNVVQVKDKKYRPRVHSNRANQAFQRDPEVFRNDKGPGGSREWSNNRPRPPHNSNNRPGNWNGNDRPGHWNGHDGRRDYRKGYRRSNDGWWYPLAAFGAGAVLGGALTAPSVQAAPAYGNSHTNWCANRYRSYRPYDNTFQPYNGPRQQCYSPYS